MNKYWKKTIAFLTVVGIAATATACSNNDATVASYKGGKITQSEYYDKMKKSQAGQSSLANMIISRTLEQQYGNKVSQKKINKQYNTYKKQYGSQFATVLSENGMTASTFKDNLKTSLLSEAALKDIKKVTTAQEKKAWKSYQPKVEVQHILVAKKATATQIIKDLENGQSFATLASKYSTDTATKKKAGKLPSFDSTDTSLDSTFKTAAFKLKTGEYTKTPVKTQYGYHVIKMIKHPSKGSFSDHKKAIDSQIYTSMLSNQTTMQSVISTVLKRASVSIKDSDLKNVLSSYVTSSTTSSTTK